MLSTTRRTSRRRTRRRYRRKVSRSPVSRRSRRRIAIGGGAVVTTVAALAAGWVLLREPRTSCQLALAIGVSGDEGAEESAEQVESAKALLRRYGGCENVLVGRRSATADDEVMWIGPLRGRGESKLDREDDAKANRSSAGDQVDRIFGQSSDGLTDYVGLLHDLDDAVDELPDDATVEAWLYGDQVSIGDLANAFGLDLSPDGVEALLDRLRPLPDLRHFHIRFVGVNRAGGGPYQSEAVERAWRRLIEEAGGEVESFTPTYPR